MFGSIVRRAASSTVQVGRGSASASSNLAAASRTRTSTHITGVAVHPAPLAALENTYTSTLSLLKTLPEESVYRNATSAVTEYRLAALRQIVQNEKSQGRSADNEEAISLFEEKMDQGLVEEVLNQAQHEQKLVAKMAEWKA